MTLVIEAAKTLKRHWDGVLAFIRSRITNGVVEGLTGKIKTALKQAYGFKTFENYRTYLPSGRETGATHTMLKRTKKR